MSKICILSAVNIKHMSLISLYTTMLEKDKIDYDIIYMDKYGEDEDIGAKNKYVFKNIIDPKLPKWRKLLLYWKFRSYAIDIINKNKYDFIIVWNDVAIFMFADYLRRKMSGKYCLNIRDYCHQKNYFVFRRFEKVIKRAAFTTISSPGYQIFLPKHNYIHVHSLNPAILESINPRTRFNKKTEPIKIGFVGYIRFFDLQKRMLDLFKNDSRFELHFYGAHAEELESYARNNNIHNTAFHGSFPVEDTAKYLSKIDIINNIYGNNTISLDYALSIKLYHGVYSRIPILVCPNTYMEKITSEYNIGFTNHEYSDKMKDELFAWYHEMNFDKFDQSCKHFIEKVNTDKQLFIEEYNKHIAHI